MSKINSTSGDIYRRLLLKLKEMIADTYFSADRIIQDDDRKFMTTAEKNKLANLSEDGGYGTGNSYFPSGW